MSRSRTILFAAAAIAAGLAVAGFVLRGDLGLGAIGVQGAPPPFRGDSRPYVEIQPPRALPPLVLERPDGSPIGIADLKGRVVVLNLWATWCAPCVREMPALDRLQGAFDPMDVTVVALSLDRGGAAQVKPFFAETGIKHLSVYLDPKMSSMSALKPRGLPTTLVIDREGREVGRLEGAAAWDSPDAHALLRHYIGTPPATTIRTGG